MRLISFALTTPQFYRREKIVTRRMGWEDVAVGELLCGVERCQGLAKGESPVRLAIIRVTDVRRERLNKIDVDDVIREGFPFMTPREFVEMFCESHQGCKPRSTITRIGFDYIPGGRYPLVGFCRRCGCFQDEACFNLAEGPCWWVDDAGKPTANATTLCSHCFHSFESDLSDLLISAEMERA